MTRTLIRTDKNGTEYYHCVGTCCKCGGAGRIEHFSWYEDGICFDCGGTGMNSWEEKVYTEEYQEKLRQRQIERIKKNRPAHDQKFFKENGISEDGNAWIVLGNTYLIKDKIKEKGGKFNGILGWHFDHEVDEFETVKLTATDMFTDDISGYDWKTECKDGEDIFEMVERIREEYTKQTSTSEYVGTIGEKVAKNLKYVDAHSFDTAFGTTHIYKFIDDENNELIWKTSSIIGYYKNNEWVPVTENEIVFVKGSIKELKEYKGTKQTILTRCKITERE